MKRVNIIAINLVIALTISVITSIVHATDVYLENSYGATIKYITAAPIPQPEEYPLNDTIRSNSLGDVNHLMKTGLSIRTTGMGSGYGLSPYTNLDSYLIQITREEEKHPNSDAVINVGPGGVLGWHITIYWVPKNASLQTFLLEEEIMPLEMREAQNLQQYYTATITRPAMFYNDDILQATWFDRAVAITKKQNPSFSDVQVIKAIHNIAMRLVYRFNLLNTTNIGEKDVTTSIEKAINATNHPTILLKPEAKTLIQYRDATKLSPELFYKNNRLQQSWFKDAVRITKKENPSFSDAQVTQAIRNIAIRLVGPFKINNITENDIISAIKDALTTYGH